VEMGSRREGGVFLFQRGAPPCRGRIIPAVCYIRRVSFAAQADGAARWRLDGAWRSTLLVQGATKKTPLKKSEEEETSEMSDGPERRMTVTARDERGKRGVSKGVSGPQKRKRGDEKREQD